MKSDEPIAFGLVPYVPYVPDKGIVDKRMLREKARLLVKRAGQIERLVEEQGSDDLYQRVIPLTHDMYHVASCLHPPAVFGGDTDD